MSRVQANRKSLIPELYTKRPVPFLQYVNDKDCAGKTARRDCATGEFIATARWVGASMEQLITPLFDSLIATLIAQLIAQLITQLITQLFQALMARFIDPTQMKPGVRSR
jgi:hypothetical protein